MVESIGNTDTQEKKTEQNAPTIADKSLHLCMVGVDKHWIEKDLIKFLRKSFALSGAKTDQ